MWTKLYNGFYINGYCDRDECHVPGLGRYISYRAAQIAITRHLKALIKEELL